MKKYILLFMVGLISISCIGQKNEQKTEVKESEEKLVEPPKGTWKVNKEFDEKGNLISYDSIYSWSSNGKFDNLSFSDKDSLMQSLKSRFFTNYLGFEKEGFEPIFSKDTLSIKGYFNDDFFGSNLGNEFMDVDKLRQQMIAWQKKFSEKYQSGFIKPEDKDEN
jgi:hypothetical protein